MKNKRTELKVTAIRSGTVIDHIPSEFTFRVFKILGLEQSDNPVYFGTNLGSKKLGKKGIIKINGKFFKPEEVSKIALVAPKATLIEIKDYEVVKKQQVDLPEKIDKIVKCFNPRCVTNNQNISTSFSVITDQYGRAKLSCHFCEKTMSLENIDFL